MSTPSEEDVRLFARRMFDLARSGSSDELGAYVEAGLPVDMANDKGDTLLMLATYHDHPDTVRTLLAHGADTDLVNDRGRTALTAAVFRHSPESVAALLAAGADPLDGTPSAVEAAQDANLPEILDLLRGND